MFISGFVGIGRREMLRFEDAVEQFNWALDDSGYSLGTYFAAGECLRSLGRLDEALENFMGVLKQVDLSTIRPEDTDELLNSYDSLAKDYSTAKDREAVVSFINQLVQFLSGEHWEDRVFGARQQLNRLGGARVISLAEMLTLPEAELVLDSMVRSQEYLAQGLLHTASDE